MNLDITPLSQVNAGQGSAAAVKVTQKLRLQIDHTAGNNRRHPWKMLRESIISEKMYETWYGRKWAYMEKTGGQKTPADRLAFHLMQGETGCWIRDPNGLCQVKGEPHIYYALLTNRGIKTVGSLPGRICTYQTSSANQTLFPDGVGSHPDIFQTLLSENGKINFFMGNIKLFKPPDYACRLHQQWKVNVKPYI